MKLFITPIVTTCSQSHMYTTTSNIINRINVIPIEDALKNFNTKQYIINGRLEWNQHLDKIVNNDTILIRNMGDIHPEKNTMKLNCETLVVDHCDKNFVYYWIKPSVFPKVRKIFLLSHPCEPFLFNIWYNLSRSENSVVPTIYLAEWYQRYKNRWANDMENVLIINENEIKVLSSKLN